jgi:hypothetical protein
MMNVDEMRGDWEGESGLIHGERVIPKCATPDIDILNFLSLCWTKLESEMIVLKRLDGGIRGGKKMVSLMRRDKSDYPRINQIIP